MKISKKDALTWFEFFAALPDEQELMPYQQELVFAVLAQIETAVEHRFDSLAREINGLRSLDGRTYFVGDAGKFPSGCRACLTGNGLNAVRKTNKCNIACKFCYNYGELDCQPPIGEGMWEIGGTKFRVSDLELLLRVYPKPSGISYVYLEPFMEIEAYYPVIEIFRKANVHQHLYTNGLLATRESLRLLGEAGLDELRFNLGASDCADRVIEAMRAAKAFIPRVGIETPMTSAFFNGFLAKKDAILSTGLDFINCAELHLNANNIGNYINEPMYCHRHGYISPIASRELTLKFMKIADDARWDLAVHDCCNHTKFARDLNLRAKEGAWFGASGYASEFETLPYAAFLPTLRDPHFEFLEEEALPKGYRPGEFVY